MNHFSLQYLVLLAMLESVFRESNRFWDNPVALFRDRYFLRVKKGNSAGQMYFDDSFLGHLDGKI